MNIWITCTYWIWCSDHTGINSESRFQFRAWTCQHLVFWTGFET